MFAMVLFIADIKAAHLSEADGGNNWVLAQYTFTVAVPGDGIVAVTVIIE
jgi:hypothetical protein